MRRLLPLLLPAVVWAGGAFWEADPDSWTREQLEQIVWDSPWAQPADVTFTGDRGGGSGVPGVGVPSGRRGPTRGGTGGVSFPWPGAGGGIGFPLVNEQLEQDDEAVVRWRSALPVREALARLHGEELKGEPLSYVVELTALPLGAAYLADTPETLRNSARLAPKDRQQIAPERVDILPRPGAPGVLFYFPRGGIEEDDKTVEFLLRAGDYQTTAKFKLKSMTYLGRLAL